MHLTRTSFPTRLVRLASFALAVVALVFATGCSRSEQRALLRAELERVESLGVHAVLVDVPPGGSFDETVRQARQDHGGGTTLLVLSARDALVVPSGGLEQLWTDEATQSLVSFWVEPYLRAGDLIGARQAFGRGFTDAVYRKKGIRRDKPLPPILGPTEDRYDIDQALPWGLPFALFGFVAVDRLRRRLEAAPVATAPSRSTAPADAATATRRRRDALAVAGLVVATTAAYLPSLEAPFLWDDRVLIVEQLLDRDAASPLADVFLRPFWRETAGDEPYRGFFRPITTASYFVDARVHGDNPAGFHLTNVVLHVLVTAAAFRLFRGFGARPVAAGLAAGAFALAPRLAECVAWISGRTDVLAVLFGVLGLLAYPMPSRPTEEVAAASPLRPLLAAALFLASFLSKEVGLAFAALVVVDEAHHALLGAPDRVRQISAARRLWPLAIVTLAYVGLRWSALRDAPPFLYDYGGHRGGAVLEAIATYAAMIIDFARPRTQIGYLLARNTTLVAGGAVTALLLLALLWTFVLRPWSSGARRRSAGPLSPVALLLLLALGALLPVLHIVPLAVNVVAADRFLYGVLLGLLGAASVAAKRLPQRRARAAAAMAAVFVVASAVALSRRRDQFASEHAFWVDAAVTSHVENPLPIAELANVYYRAQEHDLSLGLYATALERFPKTEAFRATRAKIAANIANSLSAVGRYDDALRVRAFVAEAGRITAMDELQTALIHLHRADLDAAEKGVRRALGLFRNFPEARRLSRLFPELREQKARIDSGQASPFERASFLARIGARPEATRAFASLLLAGTATGTQRDEAAGYLVAFGDFDVTAAALAPRGDLPGAVVTRFTERKRLRDDALAAAPIVKPLLSALSPAMLAR